MPIGDDVNMKMKTYIARRLGFALFSLLGLSILVFYLARVIPGDPVLMMVTPGTSPDVIEALRQRLGLKEPLHLQYLFWLGDVFRGDLGFSVYTQRNVTDDVLEYLPISLELVVLAALMEIAGSFLLGVLAGTHAYKWPDNLVRIASYIGISVPAFVWAIVFQLIFALQLSLFPTGGLLDSQYMDVIRARRVTGFTSLDSLIAGRFDAFVNFVWHATLPALALCIGGMAQDARIIRAGMVENKEKEYIAMATSQGLPQRLVMFKYLLKPSIIPAVTVMGMDIAAMLGNAFLVEKVFMWPGFSQHAIAAMLRSDLNTIVATVIVIGIIFAIVNIITDIVVAYLDPRIRLMERGE